MLIALSISHFLLGKMEQTKAGTFICFCSRNLNVIYIIQWLIIAWTVAFVTAMEYRGKTSGGKANEKKGFVLQI